MCSYNLARGNSWTAAYLKFSVCILRSDINKVKDCLDLFQFCSRSGHRVEIALVTQEMGSESAGQLIHLDLLMTFGAIDYGMVLNHLSGQRLGGAVLVLGDHGSTP